MRQLSSVIEDAKVWVEKNIENHQVVSSTLFEKKVQSKIYEKAKDKKPTIAVYGESQVGKSYLMSGLFKYKERFFVQIRGSHNSFEKHIIDGKYIDFLISINPDGGRESSGIVTRFTSSTSHQRDDAPLKVEFLRQVDLAIIIVDTYTMDFETDDSSLSYEEVVKLLQNLSAEATSAQEGMSEDDVVEFKLYLQKYLGSNDVVKLINNARLWDDIIKLLPKLSWDKRYLVLELFWGKTKAFTQLFNYLSGVLKQLSFIKEANLDLNALIPKKVNGAIPASIIDVGTAQEVITQNKLDKRVDVYTQNQIFSGFYVGDITAIIKELTLTIDDRVVKEKTFLNDVDVLDFPGARNRRKFDINSIKQIEQFNSFNIDDEEPILHECLVRGKVNYLFNNYSDSLDITTLIFAQKDGNQEINTLPKQIDNWVVNTHGSSPAERSGKSNNLFIAFLRFNNELNGKPSEIEGDITQYEQYWHNRFKINVEKFISQQIRTEDNWIANWADGKRFKNFLFLRDPAFQQSVTIEGGVERYSSPFYQRKHEDMKKSFLSSAIVKEFVENPLELWENSASLGKTGIDYIIQKAFSVTTKAVRVRQVNDRLKKVAKEVFNLIAQYYQSGDYSKVLDESTKKTVLLIKELLISMQNFNSFGYILDSLNIKESLAWKTMFDLNNPIFSYDEEDNNSSSTGEVDIDLNDIIDSLGLEDEFGDILGDTQKESQTVVTRKTQAQQFADMLLQNWEGAVRERLELKLSSFGISNDSFEWLLQLIKESGQRVEISKEIAKANAKFIEQYVGNEDIIYLVARVAKNYLNRHINSVGWAYVDINQRPTIDNKKIFDYYLDSFIYKSPDIKEIETLVKAIFEKEKKDFYFVGGKFLKEWLKALQEAAVANVEYKFKEGGVVKNPQENEKLGKILEEIEQF